MMKMITKPDIYTNREENFYIAMYTSTIYHASPGESSKIKKLIKVKNIGFFKTIFSFSSYNQFLDEV